MRALSCLPVLAIAVAACRGEGRAPAPAADAPAGQALAAPAPPPAPVPIPVRSATSLEPGGPVALSAVGESVVEASATFRVELAGRLEEVRLVLLDERDALVPATSSRELGASTRLDLAPEAKLVPASRYLLRVEGIDAPRPQDAAGRILTPVSFALVVAGDAPPPPRRRRR